MKKLIILAFLSITLSAISQEMKLEKIDALIESKVGENDPGLAIGIVKDGRVVYEKYRGLSNLQHQVKFNEKTRSNIASTAKQFTALMILDLALNEALSLEDDIRKYLPLLYPKVKEQIKIRHLINHTSGIRDYVELLDMDGQVWWQRFKLDNEDVIALLQKQEDIGFKPGTVYGYSNSNYVVLAEIIAKVTGESFNSYSKQYFKNLGMNDTYFVEKYMAVIPNRANPYSDWGRGEWWEVPTVTKTNGEGFLFTTLKDQLAYEQAVQNANLDGNQLLIKSQQPIPNSEIKSYGFGLELEDRLGRTAVHHSGGTYGFHSQTYRFPEEKFTIFIMSNNGNISSNLIAQEIVRTILPKSTNKAKYDSRLFEQEEVDKTKPVKVLGKYSYPNQNAVVEIIETEGEKYWKEKNFTVGMISEEQDQYYFSNNPKLKVVFFENEMVEFYPSGKTMAYKRIDESPITLKDLSGLVGEYYNKELEVSFQLKLSSENELKLKLSSDEEFDDVTIYNRTYMSAGNFFLKIQRDAFDRVTNVLLTYGRAMKMSFKKKTNLKFQPQIPTEDGSIQVTTVGSKNGETSDILLTKNAPNGNEIWSKRLGGKSWDKANSILDTEDGYLVIGSTSSYGNGNYDMYVIKTDKKGKQLWQNTYGYFDNEYAYTAEKTENGYLIKGTIQQCNSKDVLTRTCTTNVWFVSIDKNGKEIDNQILEIIRE
ncbi:MAG: serine hydrolase domain-containing protein [Bacteroidota bacterium]